jgi:hypothetical protein
MSGHLLRRTVWALVMVPALSALLASPARAQAWLPAKKSGSFDFIYVRGTADHHLFSESLINPVTGDTGSSQDLGQEFVNTGFLRMDYGLTDRLAVSGDLAYVSAKYDSQYQAFFGEGKLDDGAYHGTFQDLRAEVRYAAVQTKNLAFTPFAGVVIPTHQYENEGHAAPGRGNRQLPIGVNLGYLWPHAVHTAYAEGRYAYSFLETDGFHFNRSNAYVEAGTFLTPSFSVRGVVGWERTHGGIDWATDINTLADFEVHDARTSSRYWSAGLGVSFYLARSAGISASYSRILSGANVVDTRSFVVVSSWFFGPHAAPLASARNASQTAALLRSESLE